MSSHMTSLVNIVVTGRIYFFVIVYSYLFIFYSNFYILQMFL